MEAGTIIRESKEYIEKHIDEALTVAKIAGAVGYSEYHFSRIFRKETGVSVMEYVKSEKLRRASEEIRNPTMDLPKHSKRSLVTALPYCVPWLWEWNS